MAAAVESVKQSPGQLKVPSSPGPPPSPPASPYCVELPQDVVEKIAELDLELSEGDITQKGYEKKKNKLLAPFLRENQPVVTPSKVKEEARNGDSKPTPTKPSLIPVPVSSISSSSTTSSAAPSAPPAESSLTASGTSGLSDSSGLATFFY